MGWLHAPGASGCNCGVHVAYLCLCISLCNAGFVSKNLCTFVCEVHLSMSAAVLYRAYFVNYVWEFLYEEYILFGISGDSFKKG